MLWAIVVFPDPAGPVNQKTLGTSGDVFLAQVIIWSRISTLVSSRQQEPTSNPAKGTCGRASIITEHSVIPMSVIQSPAGGELGEKPYLDY
jgi:hypothetical protein